MRPMSRGLLLVPALCLALAPAGVASISTNRWFIHCKADQLEFLAVRKGQLTAGEPTDEAYKNQDAPELWYVAGTQIKSSVGGGYLTYHPSGKDNQVFLARA